MLYFFFGIFCRCRRIRTGCFFHLSGYLDDGSLTGNGSRFQADPSRTDAFGQFGQGGLADGMADGEDDLFMDIVRQGADVVLDAFVVDDAVDGLSHELAVIAVTQGGAADLDGRRFSHIIAEALFQVLAGSALDAQTRVSPSQYIVPLRK